MGNRLSFRMTHLLRLGVATSALVNSGAAFAQEAAEIEPKDEIVVTGTLIRGIAPGGSQTIGVDEEAIAAIGAANTSDLLSSVPQGGTFNEFVGVRGTSNFALSVNRPTLRYLGNTGGATNSTLLLVDGHRMPGMGVKQTTPDLDAIPASAISRVEIVTDGGSSTYGSDAVGGVMNIITYKDFDGVDAKASYGFGDEYSLANASIIAGKSWDGGNAYFAYDYSWHDEIYGGDRAWSQNLDWIATQAAGSPVGLSVACPDPNINFGSNRFGFPGLGPANRCDSSELGTIYPRESKHSALASLLLDNGGPISFAVKAFYVNRETISDGGPLITTSAITIPATSPFYQPVPGQTGNQLVTFDFSPVFGNHTKLRTSLESYGITPTIKADIGSGWELNVLAHYGVGKSVFRGQLEPNLAPIRTAAAAGTFDPFNLTAGTNSAALAAAIDNFRFGRGRNELVDIRAVVDGSLFDLPAGTVKTAFGIEFMNEDYVGNNAINLTAAAVAALGNEQASRTVKSAFGELNIPLLGGNMGGIEDLSVTLSGRYDDYSDFGDTFNPKIGVNFAPFDWLRFRGNWGEAYQAPGISDIALATDNRLVPLPLSVRPFLKPGLPANGRTLLAVLGGTVTPLQPQTAKTWSVGGDIEPPFIRGLSAGLTYYNIQLKGAIAGYPIFLPSFYADFPEQVASYDQGDAALQAKIDEFISLVPDGQNVFNAQFPGGLGSIYAVMDGRTANLGEIRTDGLDFYLRYNTDTSFGSVFADVSGTYILSFKNRSNPAADLVEQSNTNTVLLRVSSTIGADIGNLRAQVTWKFTDGFKTVPSASNLQQERIADFHVFNAFFKYDLPSDSNILQDTSLTLNVDNVFDQDPPLYRGASNSLFGSFWAFTLGRVVKLGVRKKF